KTSPSNWSDWTDRHNRRRRHTSSRMETATLDAPATFKPDEPETPSTFVADPVAPSKPAPSVDHTLMSQLAVKVPEVVQEWGVSIKPSYPGMDPKDAEILNRTVSDLVTQEA